MKKQYSDLPFSLGAPSMVLEGDHIRNVHYLADKVDDIQIVLFHNPAQNNIPTIGEVQTLRRMGEQEGITFTVHLPSSLEPASKDRALREESLRLAKEICFQVAELDPAYFIIHIPVSKPTLVVVPGLYFNSAHGFDWQEWRRYAKEFLEKLQVTVGGSCQILVENINYSPLFLEPFLKAGGCRICLDIGHLLLGNEDVLQQLHRYVRSAPVIHLHGVVGYEEHLSLEKNQEHVAEWLACLEACGFDGILTLEVFSPQDLESSIEIVRRTLSPR